MSELEVVTLKSKAFSAEIADRRRAALSLILMFSAAVLVTTVIAILASKFFGVTLFFDNHLYNVMAIVLFGALVLFHPVLSVFIISQKTKDLNVGYFLADHYLMSEYRDPEFEMHRIAEIANQKKSFSDLSSREIEAIKQGYIYNLLELGEVFSLDTMQKAGSLNWHTLPELEAIFSQSKKPIESSESSLETRLFDRSRPTRSAS